MNDYQAIYQATSELSKLLLEESDLDTVLKGIGNLAVAAIPSCEEAGVTLETDGRMTARTTTGETAERVDAHQYEIDEGPCVSARQTHRPVLIATMASDVRWPRFSKYAASQGVKSSYAVPMTIGDQMIGVLNLYSIDDPFGEEDQAVGVKFAEQAAMAVRHAETFAKTKEMIEHLHRALETRDTIGAAVGILMHRDGITMDVGFTRLKEISQRDNLKLREVAEQILSQFEI
jgi:GAF domain-containing protein